MSQRALVDNGGAGFSKRRSKSEKLERVKQQVLIQVTNNRR